VPAATTADLIDAIAERLASDYVFPELGRRAVALLQRRLEQGAYPESPSPDICHLISNDLLETSQDKHLRLLWHDAHEDDTTEIDPVAALRARIIRENHGVRRAERLPGNVGLVALTIVPEASTGAPTMTAAMQLICHTRALILDLRRTLGGSPDGVVFFASHFFPDGETHLGDFVEDGGKQVRQFWTSPYLPGPRYLDRPVYVLTGPTTFSGGEALAYDLQAHGRAAVVGSATRGGAHPSEVVQLTDHVELRLPVARPINAVTRDNWEGVGVRPDVEVAEIDAFDAAYRAALEAIVMDQASDAATVIEAETVLRNLRGADV
jgi:C-terminal processing protease CtpA/Prc